MPEFNATQMSPVNKILAHHESLILSVLDDIMLNHTTTHEALERIKEIINSDPENELKQVEKQFKKDKDIKEAVLKLTDFLASFSNTDKLGNPLKEAFTKTLKKILSYCSKHRSQLVTAYDFWSEHFLSHVVSIRDAHWLFCLLQSYASKQEFFRFNDDLLIHKHPKLSRDNLYLLKKLIREHPLEKPRSIRASRSGKKSSSTSDSDSDNSSDSESSCSESDNEQNREVEVDIDEDDDLESCFEEPIESSVLVEQDIPGSPKEQTTSITSIFADDPVAEALTSSIASVLTKLDEQQKKKEKEKHEKSGKSDKPNKREGLSRADILGTDPKSVKKMKPPTLEDIPSMQLEKSFPFEKTIFSRLSKRYGKEEKKDEKKEEVASISCIDKKEAANKKEDAAESMWFDLKPKKSDVSDEPDTKDTDDPEKGRKFMYYSLGELFELSNTDVEAADVPLNKGLIGVNYQNQSEREQLLKKLEQDIKIQSDIEKDKHKFFESLHRVGFTKDAYDLLTEDQKRNLLVSLNSEYSGFSKSNRLQYKELLATLEQKYPDVLHPLPTRFERYFAENDYLDKLLVNKPRCLNSIDRSMNHMVSVKHQVNMAVVGSKGSGKTTLIRQLSHDQIIFPTDKPGVGPTVDRPICYSMCLNQDFSNAPFELNLIETPASYFDDLSIFDATTNSGTTPDTNTDNRKWIFSREVDRIVVMAEYGSEESFQYATRVIEFMLKRCPNTSIILCVNKADQRPIYNQSVANSIPRHLINQDVLQQEKYDIFSEKYNITLLKDISLVPSLMVRSTASIHDIKYLNRALVTISLQALRNRSSPRSIQQDSQLVLFN